MDEQLFSFMPEYVYRLIYTSTKEKNMSYSRRTFLQKSAMTAAGLALGQISTSADISDSRQKIGAGNTSKQSGAHSRHEQISLDGIWEKAITQATGDSPPGAGWKDEKLPTMSWASPDANGSHFLWYRREVTIPAGWKGKRIFLDVRGAKFDPHVYINGKLMGSQFNGWSPFEAEITSEAIPGRNVRIFLRCQDNGIGQCDGTGVDGAKNRGKYIIPLGGYAGTAGPWDSIYLRATPVDRIPADDLKIIPSTRNSKLTISGFLDSKKSGLWVEARVIDNGKEALRIAGALAEMNNSWSISSQFPHAHCWSPEDPHLYMLEITLRHGRGGKILDVISKRFGFKEVWRDGSDFYLNGIRRHLLASSTWPIWEDIDKETIRKRIRMLRYSNTIAFRYHTCIWKEAWLDIADEEGVLIADEAPYYEPGSYAFTDPRFMENYRDCVRGMVKRDQNHACLFMFSLGNELLFVGGENMDRDLPHKMAEMARYTRELDPHHLLIYEGDLDPEGALDMIGLHYPHELPWSYDYPNTCDWLGARITTQAAGGMLGQKSSSFFWDRKKPLYIGEYLWTPQGDFSCASIFYGDRAYLNRDEYHSAAQRDSFYDQTIAYRRSGVTGISPWSAFGFGMVVDDMRYIENERQYYWPVAAFWKTRALRFFSGDNPKLEFDVFNDSERTCKLKLELRITGKTTPAASASLTLEPGGYQAVTLPVTLPSVRDRRSLVFESVLISNGKVVHTQKKTLSVEPKNAIETAEKIRLVYYDPAGKWSGSVTSLNNLKEYDPASTILVLAPDALSPRIKSSKKLPIISASNFDTNSFTEFIKRGGKAIVLEQSTLAPLGIDLSLVDHSSTMTFPLRKSHPILAGLREEDIKFWQSDNYVSKKEILRPSAYGAQAVTVSGSQDYLNQAPIVDMPYGRGRVLLIQALVGKKMNEEPAARQILQNAVNYLGSITPAPVNPTIVISDKDAFISRLEEIGLAYTRVNAPLSADSLKVAGWLILHGGGDNVQLSAQNIAEFIQKGGNLYWHKPEIKTFNSLQNILGAAHMNIEPLMATSLLCDREEPLMTGVSREDLAFCYVDPGWDRKMQYEGNGASCIFLPDRNISQKILSISAGECDINGGASPKSKGLHQVSFTQSGSLTHKFTVKSAGQYILTLMIGGKAAGGSYPLVMILVNGNTTMWFPLVSDELTGYSSFIDLSYGENTIEIKSIISNQGEAALIDNIKIEAPSSYANGAKTLVYSGALVTWNVGKSRIVLDGIQWDIDNHNAGKGRRFASSFLANLEMPFATDKGQAGFESIPLKTFSLVGASPYFSSSSDTLSFYNDGLVQSSFMNGQTGNYQVRVEGYSTPCRGEYARVNILIDGKIVSTLEIASSVSRAFVSERFPLMEGEHTVGIAYINDETAGNEDRNFFLKGVAFVRN
jgi:hypothetical protein